MLSSHSPNQVDLWFTGRMCDALYSCWLKICLLTFSQSASWKPDLIRNQPRSPFRCQRATDSRYTQLTRVSDQDSDNTADILELCYSSPVKAVTAIFIFLYFKDWCWVDCCSWMWKEASVFYLLSSDIVLDFTTPEDSDSYSHFTNCFLSVKQAKLLKTNIHFLYYGCSPGARQRLRRWQMLSWCYVTS